MDILRYINGIFACFIIYLYIVCRHTQVSFQIYFPIMNMANSIPRRRNRIVNAEIAIEEPDRAQIKKVSI
jgi:hypothetical protein